MKSCWLQVLGDADTWDAAALVSGLLQLVSILRGTRSSAEKTQQLQQPIVPVLMRRVVDLAPTASHAVCTPLPFEALQLSIETLCSECLLHAALSPLVGMLFNCF